ncbi:MAG: Glutamate synthase [NADPH] small chain (EC [uncultured Sulfurovum sp.]|uniref:Glutamate synthase [NADPH] small chain (EC) n=1 Tax=uncultured Sulfurovum sp. TaxID=269237 RepID=A0A6S6S4P0_9BACT|nr:MAG: Glutamate synthase [NADPH] small chain (EC [uncultured Sulfurovum sp.]
MLKFFDLERIDAKKRSGGERVKDFKEIYEVFPVNKAAEQSERCIQCGDPYCHSKCPLHNLIPQWLKSTAGKDLELAFALSNQPSPFPEVLGKICPHDRLCEGDCTLNDGHGAITIGSIETFITEEGFKQGMKPRFADVMTDKKVAIVGAGPAGLSAATFLLRDGINVEIFDKQAKAGGLLTYGIPGFKLDKAVVEKRVDLLKEAGAIFHQDCEVGKDVTFSELEEEFDAVFIGVGATQGRASTIDGADAKEAYLAMEFLTNIQKKIFGEEYDKSITVKDKKVVVVGGGDTAMDCVRTSLREKARSVECLYRRDAHNMPGSQKEYINAREEGVDFEFYASPKSVELDADGNVVGINMIKTELGEADVDGRQRVQDVEGTDFLVEADVIIFALGFSPVKYPFLAEQGIELDKWDAIKVDENYETSKAGVYAGGDCHRGADLVVTAALDGREAAKAIALKVLN